MYREPLHVLVVCMGNVCRSPMMERLLRERLPQAEVESAGVRAVVGSDMHPISKGHLEARGADTDEFKARQITRAMVRKADLVLAADTVVRGRVLEEAPTALSYTFTLRELSILLHSVPDEVSGSRARIEWAGRHRSLAGRRRIDILDPMGRSEETHARVAHLIDEHTQVVADGLQDR